MGSGNSAPRFTIDLDKSVYTKCNENQYPMLITVEQGTPFLLKYNIYAWPMPTGVTLKKDGKVLKVTQDRGTIFAGLDKMGIQRVDMKSYAGTYTISATNSEGTGAMSFKLKVTPTPGYSQVRETDPLRWC